MAYVTGVYDSPALADEAIAALMSVGLTRDEISLLASDKSKSVFATANHEQGERNVADAAIIAGAGGILTALVAGLTIVGAVVIPGAQLLVAGPLAATLTGLGAGAAVGGIAGALSTIGITTTEASKYETELRAGKAVLVAHTNSDAQNLAARSALMNTGAQIKAA